MGSNGASSGGGNSRSDAFVNKKSKVKTVKRDKFGYEIKENPITKFVKGGGITGAIVSTVLPAGEKINREYYDTKVKNYSGNTKGTYEDYIKSRGRGEVDAMGRTISQSDGGGNQVVQAPEVKAPKSIEVSQVTPLLPEVTAEEARATANELIRKRRRGRGRSLSMLQTSSEGLNNEGLTLSKKILLG